MALRDRGGKLDRVRQSALSDAGECAVEFVKARPECRLKKWDGEADIGIRYAGVSAQLEELSRGAERVKWGGGDLHVEAYTLPAGPGMEDGGFELELVLAVQPATNRFDFIVDGDEDYDWWFQPPLTAEQIAQGRIRPENVVNSYAVYHKVKRDHIRGRKNYGTGKAFHVYRPKLIDADGTETWGSLSYAGGVLTVEIPQEALDKAAYPARIDPTFGNTTLQSSQYGVQGYLFGGPGTPASAGEVDSIHVGCSPDSPANVKGVLILASTEAIVTNGVTPEVSVPATGMGFKTLTYSTKPAVAASTVYYACFIIDPLAPTTAYAYDSGGTNGTVEDASNTYSSPTDLVSPTYYNEFASFYATYTESGGGTTVDAPSRSHTYTVQTPQVRVRLRPDNFVHTYTAQSVKVQPRVQVGVRTHTYTPATSLFIVGVVPPTVTYPYTGWAPQVLSGISPAAVEHEYTGRNPTWKNTTRVGVVTATYAPQATQARASVGVPERSHLYTTRTPTWQSGINVPKGEQVYTARQPNVRLTIDYPEFIHAYIPAVPQVRASVMPAGAIHIYQPLDVLTSGLVSAIPFTHTYVGQVARASASVSDVGVVHTYAVAAPGITADAGFGVPTAVHVYVGEDTQLKSSIAATTPTHQYTSRVPNASATVGVAVPTVTHTYVGAATKVNASVAPNPVTHVYMPWTAVGQFVSVRSTWRGKRLLGGR